MIGRRDFAAEKKPERKTLYNGVGIWEPVRETLPA